MAAGANAPLKYTKGASPDAATEAIDTGRTDTSIPLTVPKTTHGISNIITGRKVVATANTRLALAVSTFCRFVLVQALPTNTGTVVVGDVGVVALAASRQGFALPTAGVDWWQIDVNNLSIVYIDSETAGDGVSFTYGVID